jgi:phenylacetaldehyde dehydrogenase
MDTLFVDTRVGQPTAMFLRREHRLIVGGKWLPALSGKTFDTYDPGTGRVIARIAEGNAADVELAVAAARHAFSNGPWHGMTPSDRSRLIWKIGDLLDQHAGELAELDSLNNGMPFEFARLRVLPGCADMFRYMAGWVSKVGGETLPTSLRANSMPSRCVNPSVSLAKSPPGTRRLRWRWSMS